MVGDRLLETEHPVVDKAHEERRGEQFRNRGQLEHRGGCRWRTELQIGATLSTAIDHVPVLHDRHRQSRQIIGLDPAIERSVDRCNLKVFQHGAPPEARRASNRVEQSWRVMRR